MSYIDYINQSVLSKLIKQEFDDREKRKDKLNYYEQQVKNIIETNFEIGPRFSVSREEFQDFCFRQIFNRTCHVNVPFTTYLNKLMPKIGYPKGSRHNNVKVYRGLKWKSK